MKKLLLFALSVVLFTACTSSKKLLEKGKYDEAIEKSVENLRKDPGNQEELDVLREAYQQANLLDKDRIDFLKKENREENWIEIYRLYSSLKNRQNLLKTLPSSVRNQFAFVDYDDRLIEAKGEAAEVSYSRGIEYLESGGKQNARAAYREFSRVRNIYPDYKDVNLLLQESLYLGTNHVLFQVENNSEVLLPRDFDTELKKISLKDLNRRWLNYDTYADSTVEYDYFIVLNIKEIAVSPESIERKSWTDTKEIQDGYTYVYDDNGNVKKDSAGNDIKVPNYVTIAADVNESYQHKEAFIGGSVDYIDLYSNQLIKTEEISVTAVFEHYSAVFSGNKKALSDESLKLIQSKPLPFPSDEAMLLDAASLLKNRTKRIVHNHRRILEN